MGFLSQLFGTDNQKQSKENANALSAQPLSADEQAVQRYRYMIETAPPETIEQAHAEAFARLTPEQRRKVLAELARAVPENERAAAEATSTDDPKALARLATRTELRQPGFMERTLGAGLGGSLLTSFAAGFVGSMVAQSFFSTLGGLNAEDSDPRTSDDSKDTEEAGFNDTDTDDFGDEFDV